MHDDNPPVRQGRALRALVRFGAAAGAIASILAIAAPGGDTAPSSMTHASIVPTPSAPALAPAPAPPPPVMLDPGLEPLRGGPGGADAYESREAPFPLTVDDGLVAYDVLALTALPRATLVIEAGAEGTRAGYQLRHASGEAVSSGEGRWAWTAPERPGIHALSVAQGDDGPSVRLHVLVVYPKTSIRDGALNGFRIGRYVQEPLGGREAYQPPEGFVEVAPADEDVLVSPHFTLGQFLCKQEGDPRYVAFSRPLVEKLEAVLAEANRSGIAAGTFHVMSGFRTPWYNEAIGNSTVYSRHLWGDAADIYVDVDGDADMDDLDGDGRRNTADARVLAAIVERVERKSEGSLRPGGLGIYDRNAAHGPFVHVDARGYAARW